MRARDHKTFDLFGEPPTPMPIPSEDDKLRWYQFEARASVFKELEANRSTLLVLATGLGKTETFSSVARHFKGRILVLAHRDELVTQARARLEKMTGELVETEQADLRSSKARIIVGSVQTCYRDDRLARLERNGGFELIIADECFPGDTLVDDKRIDSLKSGDAVWSVDHLTVVFSLVPRAAEASSATLCIAELINEHDVSQLYSTWNHLSNLQSVAKLEPLMTPDDGAYFTAVVAVDKA